MNNNIHVVHSDKGWQVKRENSARSLGNFETKDRAEARGIDLAKKNSCELYVHNLNGRIGYRNSYGNDPFPPRG